MKILIFLIDFLRFEFLGGSIFLLLFDRPHGGLNLIAIIGIKLYIYILLYRDQDLLSPAGIMVLNLRWQISDCHELLIHQKSF